MIDFFLKGTGFCCDLCLNFQHAETSHTLEQRQTAGFEVDLLAKKTKCGSSHNNIGPGTKKQLYRRSGSGSGSGAFKAYVCKQCGHNSKTKEEKWEHARTHIPLKKQLTCNKCTFVTNFKHHLQYHNRSHSQSKPFKCTECSHTCASNSALKSHMKYKFKDNSTNLYCHLDPTLLHIHTNAETVYIRQSTATALNYI